MNRALSRLREVDRNADAGPFRYSRPRDERPGSHGRVMAGREVRLTDDFKAFPGTPGIGVHQCCTRGPEAKSILERANGYLKTWFLRGRTFTGPADFNTQLSHPLKRAHTRPSLPLRKGGWSTSPIGRGGRRGLGGTCCGAGRVGRPGASSAGRNTL